MPNHQHQYEANEELFDHHRRTLQSSSRLFGNVVRANAAGSREFLELFLDQIRQNVPIDQLPELAQRLCPQQQQQPPQVQQQPQVQLNDPLTTILAAALIQRNQPPLPKIELFSGETDLLVFKNLFSALARESGWSLIDQANRITLYLKGKAALIYDKLTEEERTSVSKVWSALEKHFLPSENEWLARLEALTPKPNQPTREFAVMLADYYDKANPKADQDQHDLNTKSLSTK
jgi:hypothetical protein